VAVTHSCLATWWRAMRETPLPDDFAWRVALTGRGLSNADAAVVPTAAFGRAVAAAYDLPSFPDVVWNGRNNRAAPIRMGAAAPHVFAAGRLWDEAKNVDALDAMAERLSMPVLAAGPVDGPNGTRVAPRHLRLLGTLHDAQIAEHLADRPIFVSLARYEPFGLAVLEAAQAGCSLVLSDIPTLRELWDGAALFVDPADDARAAQAVEMLAGEPEARDTLGRAAADRAARYTPAAMTGGMLEIYERLLRREGHREAAE
jgi:phosphatidyl-myo-inositol alpha-mannosyltransferase